MDEAPTPSALRDAAGISISYASMIVSGTRQPARALAIHILRRTGWRHPMLAGLTDDQIATLEAVERWEPRPSTPTEKAAA